MLSSTRLGIVEAAGNWLLGADPVYSDPLMREMAMLPLGLVPVSASGNYGVVLTATDALADKLPGQLTATQEALANTRRALVNALAAAPSASTVTVDHLQRFLKVKTPDDAAAFIHSAGVLRPGDTVWDWSRGDEPWPDEASDFGRRWDERDPNDAQHHLELLMAFSDFQLEQRRLRRLLNVLTKVRDFPPDAEQVARDLDFPSASAFIRYEFLVKMSGFTTLDTTVREDGGRAVLVAQYVLPGLYALLWRGRHTQSVVRVCARPDCGNVFEVGSRKERKFCKPACGSVEKTRRARRKA